MSFVPCDHECLNFRGGEFSKSRGAVDVPYILSKYDPDPLRFYLTTPTPETRRNAIRDWEDGESGRVPSRMTVRVSQRRAWTTRTER